MRQLPAPRRLGRRFAPRTSLSGLRVCLVGHSKPGRIARRSTPGGLERVPATAADRASRNLVRGRVRTHVASPVQSRTARRAAPLCSNARATTLPSFLRAVGESNIPNVCASVSCRRAGGRGAAGETPRRWIPFLCVSRPRTRVRLARRASEASRNHGRAR
jgi:hypothetical protein